MDRDRNLLFGVLAVQLKKASPAQIMRAGEAWSADPSKPLHQYLLDMGIISERSCNAILGLVEAAIADNQGDTAATLTSLGGEEMVRFSFHDSILWGADESAPTSAGTRPSSLGTNGELLSVVDESPGRYTHVSEYGRGGMGRVLLTHDQTLGRDIALKELLPSAPPDAPTIHAGTPVGLLMPIVQRFLQEARVTGQLEHPSIVPVYELGRRVDGRLYYTMKLVRGTTLAKALRSAAGLRERLLYLPHFLDLCHAIAYAHEQHVIHRDIKPDNVMVGDFGETVVIDWGLAKVLDKPDAHAAGLEKTIRSMRIDESYVPSETEYGVALGTPVFMPPEQARGELDKVNERSDVYSLGAVLYQLITGDIPFDGSGAREILQKVINERPRRILDITPDAPPELVAICERAMDPDPQRRYANARELAAEVARFQSGALVQAYTYRFSEHLKRFIQRHKPILATAAAALLVLVCMSAYSYLRVVKERNTAIEARELAVAAQEKEKEQRETAERQLYIASIYLARLNVEAKRYDLADQALARAPEALRNWEWHYYYRLCHLDERTLAGHGYSLNRGSFSPDGARVVAASNDYTAIVWDVATGRELLSLKGHTGIVRDAHFSPSGSRIITAAYDGTIRIWDAADGKELQALSLAPHIPERAAFTPDEERALAAYLSGPAKRGCAVILDVNTGQEILQMLDPESAPDTVTLSPDGTRVIAAVEPPRQTTVAMWDVATGAKIGEFPGHTASVQYVSFSPDGKRIVTGSSDGTVKVWDTESQAEVLSFPSHDDTVTQVEFSPDGALIATASYDRTARLWDAATGAARGTLDGHSNWVNSAAFSPDGARLVTASRDGMAKLWSIAPLKPPQIVLSDGTINEAQCAVFSPDSARVVTGFASGEARAWESATGREIASLGHKRAVWSAMFSPDGARLLTAADDETATVWDTRAWTALFTVYGCGEGKGYAEFSPDGALLLTRVQDNAVMIWDAAAGRTVSTLKGHEDRVNSSRFSPDSARVLTTSADGTARVWDARSGETISVFRGHTGPVRCGRFSPDGARVATGANDKTARLWDPASGAELAVLAGHAGAVLEVDFSPDGRHIVTASTDNSAMVWDAASEARRAVLKGHHKGLFTATFSPDGSRVLTASADGTARIWTLDGKEFVNLTGHEGELTAAAYSPDGVRVVTASIDGTTRIWIARE